MKKFVTSDTFFSRPDALDLGRRSEHFLSVEQMDQTMIENWNDTVKPTDQVYHLGNFCWDPLQAEYILRRLHGTISFFPATYDAAIIEIIDGWQNPHTLQDRAILYDNKVNAVFSHWPMMDWPGKDNGVLQYHGEGIGKHPMNLELEHRVNTSVDNWNFAPLDIAAIPDMIESIDAMKKS